MGHTWGSISPDLELETGEYKPYIQAFDAANDSAWCPMTATMQRVDQHGGPVWDLATGAQPSSDLPGMLENESRRLETGTYRVDVTSPCEWLVTFEWFTP